MGFGTNVLFSGDWTNRIRAAEVCYFTTQAEAEFHRTEYCWEPDTYVEIAPQSMMDYFFLMAMFGFQDDYNYYIRLMS